MSFEPASAVWWLELLVALLLVVGGLVTLVGAIGLLRLRHFFQRMHGPAMSNTLGAICILLASLVHFSVLERGPVLHEVLIILFVLMTAPVTGMMVARAALHRQRDLPPTVPAATDAQDQAAPPPSRPGPADSLPRPAASQPGLAASRRGPVAEDPHGP